MPVFIIAEAGVAHQGSLEKACELARHAHAAGADAVKFQAYTTYDFVAKSRATYETLERCHLAPSAYAVISSYCAHLGIEFLCTPFQPRWVDVLQKLGVKRWKISSQSVIDSELLCAVAATNKPVIISNGIHPASISRALALIGRNDIHTILSCVSKYPTEEEDVDISSMDLLSAEYPVCDIGWSDHTRGMFACLAAAQAGATVIEKHFGLGDANEPDACCSLTPSGLAHMVKQIRAVTA